MWCSMSKTKYGECKWDGLWSVKWMRWNWVTKWMSWILVHEINRLTLVNEMNELKVTRQICNICYWQICYPKFFFININATVQLSSINAIHVKQQNNVGFFIFKFTLKYMLGNVYIIILYCLYINSLAFNFFVESKRILHT